MANKTSPPPPRTTDSIIAELIANRDARLAAGEPVDVSAVEQEITAHRQLEVLRGELAAAKAAKDWLRAADVEGHLAFWKRFVAVDVDTPQPEVGPAETPPVAG